VEQRKQSPWASGGERQHIKTVSVYRWLAMVAQQRYHTRRRMPTSSSTSFVIVERAPASLSAEQRKRFHVGSLSHQGRHRLAHL
jgi:hypothetical protein